MSFEFRSFLLMRLPSALLLCSLLIPIVPDSAHGVISDIPLSLATRAQPNIMLMLDNSGSMNNIVPDAPYDPDFVYLSSCPSGNRIPASTDIELRISSGLPRISYGGSSYPWGNGSGQRCFETSGNYKAKLSAAVSGYLPAQYTGNYLNWYFNTATGPGGCSETWSQVDRKPCTQNRMMIAKEAAKTLVGSLNDVRMGLSTYNGSSGGLLLNAIQDLNAASAASINAQIDGLTPSGNTPLAETLSDIGFYFSRGATTLTLHPATTRTNVSRANLFNNGYSRHASWGNGSNPVESSCQKSFAVLLTDGRPQADQDISSYLRDYDGDCPGCSYDRKSGREYESAGSDYLDDVAQALYEIDLRPDIQKSETGERNNIATYLISFADDQAIHDPLMRDAAGQGGGKFFTAGNETELAAAFKDAAQDILGTLSSAAAVATNSTRLFGDSMVYQAKINSADWSGQIVAYRFNVDGTLGEIQWDTDEAGKIPAHDSRRIYTWNGSAGIEFTQGAWNSLHSSQKAALQGTGGTEQQGKDRLNWIRGDQSKEESPSGGYLRKRSKILGDIVNSDPVVVGALNFRYNDLPVNTPGKSTYAAFRNSAKTRPKMLYVGGNDGMLHAFDALTGVEKFAYVPHGVFSNLAGLADPSYTHKFFVDGSPYVGDAYIGDDWKTVLVGTLGAGGRSVFALDVTDPDSFDESKILWEFTDPDLGYNLGHAVIGRMKDGQWVAIFGNGYGSNNGRAFLFVVNLKTGALIRKIDTGAGSSSSLNGLATPTILAENERVIEYAYAGDLLGNMWKFDLTHRSRPEQWDVAFTEGSNKYPLFRANASGRAQPITAAPDIGRHPWGGYMIYFGTGKYFETGDNVVGASPPVQSFYGIRDDGSRIEETDRSTLVQQTIQVEGELHSGSDNLLRVVSANSVDWESKNGWYMDLVSPVSGNQGERVVSRPLLRHGRVIFTTLIPSTDACKGGGTSWIMEVDALTGGRLGYSVFDINNRDGVSDGDSVTVTIGDKTVTVPVSGIESAVGITKTPAVISAGAEEFKISGGSKGGLSVIREKGDENSTLGRRSWRQIK